MSDLGHMARRIRELTPATPVAPAASVPAAAAVDAVPVILLRPAAAARSLNVSEKTLRRWAIPMFCFDGVRGYRPRDLEAFVARHLQRVVESQRTKTWEPV